MSYLYAFRSVSPRYRLGQRESLEWLAAAHAEAEWKMGTQGADAEERFRSLLLRFGCGPAHIATRGHELEDLTHRDFARMRVFGRERPPEGAGVTIRAELFAATATRVFESLYPEGGSAAPDSLIHVTCTGYLSPSAAQRLVAARGWGSRTEVTHAYHMGCYAAVPALRIARGALLQGARRADVVHTELCTLHLNPAAHEPEQLVVQSLFADGFIGYSAADERPDGEAPAFRLLAQGERIVPDTAEAMRWVSSEWGMRMTLSREVPALLVAGPGLASFLGELFARAGLDFEKERSECVFAVHPGGPRIIEAVRERLALREAQVAESRRVLRERGNMSSATLPHIWERLLADPDVPGGRRVASLAFGPGLTVCGTLMEKEA
ncbi:MAG: naringenin-chalcone synthase [Oligoflexia bacterium]|nr:naringenin-chalcone synthase [Oligoflexia bacterium]